MKPKHYVALSLLTILSLANTTPATAQSGTINLPSLPPVVPPPPPNLPPNEFELRQPEPAKPIVVAELVKQLRTANGQRRRNIIEQLSAAEQNIVPELVKALEDNDPLVKSGVAEVLGNFADEAVPAIPGLIRMIKDGRRAIAPVSQFSKTINTPAYPYFLNTPEKQRPPTPPQNPENLLGITAIIALGKIGLPARNAATAPLTQALQDTDPWVKLNATWALAEIGASVPLLPHWLEALQNSDPALRRSAAKVFQDRRSLLRRLFAAEANASSTTPLLTALKDEDLTVRNAASQALELLGTKALPKLVPALKAPEPIVRLEAAKLLGNLGGAAQSAAPDLITLLGDTGRYVSPNANRYRLRLSIPLNYLPLGEDPYPPAPNNPEQLVRVNAAIALGKLNARNAIPALTAALKDNNPWMQLATGWALLRLGRNQGLPVVGRLLQHPDDSIQKEVLSQLRGHGSQSSSYLVPYYSARLELANDYKRNVSMYAIGRLGLASLSPAALDLVPKLRALLVGNQKNSPGYAATTLGMIARDTAAASQNGRLSASGRQQAIAEFTNVLDIMQAPNARFNREPVERVRNALTTLRGVAQ
jgi:HEAT repeat protein